MRGAPKGTLAAAIEERPEEITFSMGVFGDNFSLYGWRRQRFARQESIFPAMNKPLDRATAQAHAVPAVDLPRSAMDAIRAAAISLPTASDRHRGHQHQPSTSADDEPLLTYWVAG